MTSLTFMLVDVPAPPWKTSTGNSSRQRPRNNVVAGSLIASTLFDRHISSLKLAQTAAFLTKSQRADQYRKLLDWDS